MKKIYIEKEILEKLYIDERKSMAQIHKELGVSLNTVKRLFNEYKIPKRSRTESSTISIKKKHDEIGRKITILQCPICGIDFSIKNSLINKAETHCCSKSCSSKLLYKKRDKPLKTRTGVYVDCLVCGDTTYKNKEWFNRTKKNHFCSHSCFFKYLSSESNLGENHPNYNRKTVKCSNCEKLISRNKYAVDKNKKYNFCSVDCMSDFYVGLVFGENHPSWKGGGNIYYGPNWSKLSWDIRTKHNFTCQRCGLNLDDFNGDTSKLIVHHINKIRNYSCYKEANKEDNLITLCRRCHGIVEQHGMDF